MCSRHHEVTLSDMTSNPTPPSDDDNDLHSLCSLLLLVTTREAHSHENNEMHRAQ